MGDSLGKMHNKYTEPLEEWGILLKPVNQRLARVSVLLLADTVAKSVHNTKY